MKPKRKNVGRSLLLYALLLLVGIGGYTCYLVMDHNFHVVVAGQVYRSSRMSPAVLARVIQSHDIKSVLSLIGFSQAESNAVRAVDAHYFDVSISDRHEVSGEKLNKIIAVLRDAPKPLLIHCKAGADRTGLAAALYCYVVKGEPAAAADEELTLRYGHLPSWLGLGTSAMDHSYWAYVRGHPLPARTRAAGKK